jgi:hypothetical protein
MTMISDKLIVQHGTSSPWLAYGDQKQEDQQPDKWTDKIERTIVRDFLPKNDSDEVETDQDNDELRNGSDARVCTGGADMSRLPSASSNGEVLEGGKF